MSEVGGMPGKAPEWRRWQQGLFGSPGNTAVTALTLALFFWLLKPAVDWLILDAIWSGAEKCVAETAGGCWAFIGAPLASTKKGKIVSRTHHL